MHRPRSALSAAALALASGLACPAAAQISVGAGETLTEADLNAGSFQGQAFTLGPGTIFDIDFGGTLGPVGDSTILPTGVPFDFQSSTVRVNNGGVIATGSVVSNAIVGLFFGGGASNGFAARAGSQISMLGGVVGNFASALDSTINIVHGGFGQSFTAGAGADILITGGGIGNGFTAIDGATVTLSGGVITDFAEFRSGSVLTVAGGAVERELQVVGGAVRLSAGSIGSGFGAFTSATVDVTGGSIGANFSTDSEVTISGGAIEDGFFALMGSRVNLLVQDLSLDGVPVSLTPGEALTITQRGGALLAATLADGSFIDFTLNNIPAVGQDFFDISATLTATLAGTVPAPGAGSLLVVCCAGGVTRRRRRGAALSIVRGREE